MEFISIEVVSVVILSIFLLSSCLYVAKRGSPWLFVIIPLVIYSLYGSYNYYYHTLGYPTTEDLPRGVPVVIIKLYRTSPKDAYIWIMKQTEDIPRAYYIDGNDLSESDKDTFNYIGLLLKGGTPVIGRFISSGENTQFERTNPLPDKH